jgi:hypothetical protein
MFKLISHFFIRNSPVSGIMKVSLRREISTNHLIMTNELVVTRTIQGLCSEIILKQVLGLVVI